MPRLYNKVALITGAARGIGAAIARAFVAEGARVWVTDICVESGASLATQLGVAARFARLDVREEADWSRVVSEVVAACDRLDVLVNNAGVTGFEVGAVAHDPENATLEAWLQVRHPGDAPGEDRLHYQHLVPLRPGRHPGGRGLRFLQGRCSQPHQDRGVVVRAAGTRHSLQLHPSRRHSDPDVGADVRVGAGP
jgi:hypothetical protein